MSLRVNRKSSAWDCALGLEFHNVSSVTKRFDKIMHICTSVWTIS